MPAGEAVATPQRTDEAVEGGRPLLIAIFLVLATLAIYWPVGSYEFADYDEQLYVTENPIVQQGLTWHGVAWAFTTDAAGNWHPLTWLSHMLDCQLFGVKPGAHHWTSVVFHILNTLALFLALTRLTGAVNRSGVVAALFALHPLHVESVAWVAERKDVLSGFFWVLALWAYAGYAKRPNIGRYLLVLAAFAGGLMSKPMVVTLPCVLLLLDFWPLKRVRWKTVQPQNSDSNHGAHGIHGKDRVFDGLDHDRSDESPPVPQWSIFRVFRVFRGSNCFSPRRLLLEKLPFFALAVVSSVLTVLAQHKGGAVGTLEKFPVSVRLANAVVSYVSYLGKTICPEDLAVLYPHAGMPPVWMTLGASVVLVCVSLLALALASRRPYLLAGWLWFLGTLVPVIGLVQVGTQSMADRYTYLPLIGIFIMITWGVADLLANRPVPFLAIAAGTTLVLGVLTAVSVAQVRYWENSFTLFTRALNVTANNATAHYNLGQAMSIQGRVAEAMPHYFEAIRIKPDYDVAHNNLGLSLALMGRLVEATNHYAAAVRSNPKNADAHFNYGLALGSLGDFDAAISHYAVVLQISPQHSGAHNWMGNALAAQNRLEEAGSHYSESVRLKPDYDDAHFNLGLNLAKQGKQAEALPHFAEAVRLNPDNAKAHAQLALALAGQHHPREALAHYREALRLKPENLEALNNLAWFLATHPQAEFRNGAQAVELAERACRLTSFKVPSVIGTLAAAYAEAGRFDEAAKSALQASTLAAMLGEASLAATNQTLLKLYQAGKAYRDTQP